MSPGQPKAAQACEACRKSKRRCSRALPQCTLCTRLRKECTYAKYYATPQLISQTNDPPSSDVDTPMTSTARSQSFPSSFFLDKQLFSLLNHQALLPTVCSLPTDLWKEIRQDTNNICAAYFATTHTWLPLLSQTYFLNDLQIDNDPTQSRDALLLLCMKLSFPSERRNSSSYQTARAECSKAVTSGAISLRLIQSLVLLAVFEIGHAIYPAAYITIGNASRLAAVLALRPSRSPHQPVATPETWRVREEKRRLWWGIFLLDRIANIGNPEIPLAMPDPTSNEILPTNDIDWDEGRIGTNEAFLSLQRHLVPVDGSFSKTLQAAYMLGKVLRHVDSARQNEESGNELLNEAVQMSRVLVSMNRCFEESLSQENPQKRTSWNCKINAISLCATARSLLYSHYAGKELVAEDSVLAMEMKREATQGIESLLATTVPIVVGMIEQSLAAPALTASASFVDTYLSPMSSHFLYEAATLLAWMVKERCDLERQRQLEEVVRTLHAVGDSWGVGGTYMKLLEQSQVLELIGWAG